MGTATRFWNWMADRYSRQAITDEASYKKKLALTQKYLTPESRVAEFGCGTGSTAVIHAPLVKSYHAIDVSERMIEIAREKAGEAGLSNFTFTVGTLEEAGLPPNSCDAVLALNILHLVPDLTGTLAAASQALEPGGHLVSSTICSRDLKGNLRLLGPVTRALPLFPSVGSFSTSDLEQQFQNAGLNIVERFKQAPGVVFHIAEKVSE